LAKKTSGGQRSNLIRFLQNSRIPIAINIINFHFKEVFLSFQGFLLKNRLFRYICHMSRILAIDYGTKRTGIAVTDPSRIIATGLTTVHSSELIRFLTDYCKKEDVEFFVVGEPRQMSNEPSAITPQIEQFIRQLKKSFPDKRVERMDERFTSKLAMQALISSGVKKSERRNKELIDVTSATIILQSYLEMLTGKK
jgi:putative holliday junction resolvase